MQTVLTYGTFDVFHIGHLRLLQRLRALGDRLIVAVSTDEFNRCKGKQALIPFEDRCEILRSLHVVDFVMAETHWDQKRTDIIEHRVAIFGMGDDWVGRFDDLRDLCHVVYLPRTLGISSTHIRHQAAASIPSDDRRPPQQTQMLIAAI